MKSSSRNRSHASDSEESESSSIREMNGLSALSHSQMAAEALADKSRFVSRSHQSDVLEPAIPCSAKLTGSMGRRGAAHSKTIVRSTRKTVFPSLFGAKGLSTV